MSSGNEEFGCGGCLTTILFEAIFLALLIWTNPEWNAWYHAQSWNEFAYWGGKVLFVSFIIGITQAFAWFFVIAAFKRSNRISQIMASILVLIGTFVAQIYLLYWMFPDGFGWVVGFF